MRLLFPVAIVCSAAALAQPAAAPIPPGQRQPVIAGSDCPDATRYLARQRGKWDSEPLRPRKLTEVPPAESFAAVVRTDERGCLVLVKYPPSRR